MLKKTKSGQDSSSQLPNQFTQTGIIKTLFCISLAQRECRHIRNNDPSRQLFPLLPGKTSRHVPLIPKRDNDFISSHEQEL